MTRQRCAAPRSRPGVAANKIPASWFGRFVFVFCVVALGLIVVPIAKSFHWGGVTLSIGIVGLLWWLRR